MQKELIVSKLPRLPNITDVRSFTEVFESQCARVLRDSPSVDAVDRFNLHTVINFLVANGAVLPLLDVWSRQILVTNRALVAAINRILRILFELELEDHDTDIRMHGTRPGWMPPNALDRKAVSGGELLVSRGFRHHLPLSQAGHQTTSRHANRSTTAGEDASAEAQNTHTMEDTQMPQLMVDPSIQSLHPLGTRHPDGTLHPGGSLEPDEPQRCEAVLVRVAEVYHRYLNGVEVGSAGVDLVHLCLMTAAHHTPERFQQDLRMVAAESNPNLVDSLWAVVRDVGVLELSRGGDTGEGFRLVRETMLVFELLNTLAPSYDLGPWTRAFADQYFAISTASGAIDDLTQLHRGANWLQRVCSGSCPALNRRLHVLWPESVGAILCSATHTRSKLRAAGRSGGSELLVAWESPSAPETASVKRVKRASPSVKFTCESKFDENYLLDPRSLVQLVNELSMIPAHKALLVAAWKNFIMNRTSELLDILLRMPEQQQIDMLMAWHDWLRTNIFWQSNDDDYDDENENDIDGGNNKGSDKGNDPSLGSFFKMGGFCHSPQGAGGGGGGDIAEENDEEEMDEKDVAFKQLADAFSAVFRSRRFHHDKVYCRSWASYAAQCCKTVGDEARFEPLLSSLIVIFQILGDKELVREELKHRLLKIIVNFDLNDRRFSIHLCRALADECGPSFTQSLQDIIAECVPHQEQKKADAPSGEDTGSPSPLSPPSRLSTGGPDPNPRPITPPTGPRPELTLVVIALSARHFADEIPAVVSEVVWMPGVWSLPKQLRFAASSYVKLYQTREQNRLLRFDLHKGYLEVRDRRSGNVFRVTVAQFMMLEAASQKRDDFTHLFGQVDDQIQLTLKSLIKGGVLVTGPRGGVDLASPGKATGVLGDLCGIYHSLLEAQDKGKLSPAEASQAHNFDEWGFDAFIVAHVKKEKLLTVRNLLTAVNIECARFLANAPATEEDITSRVTRLVAKDILVLSGDKETVHYPGFGSVG